jgi:O-acetyl-ADP-ribose deacetylase (regulator of RNase III)
MPVDVLIGDLFESDAQTLVNTVNCVGVMGRGIALGFKKRFPHMYKDYVVMCERGEVQLGRPYLYRTLLPPWVLNFPTKHHWRDVARIDMIIAGLEFLEDHVREWEIQSLAVPPLGCGEGQLEWRVVGPTLYRGLHRLGIPVTLYAPYETPPRELEPAFLAGGSSHGVGHEEEPRRVPAAWFAIAAIVNEVQARRPAQVITPSMLHPLAFLATEAGIPTQLTFAQHRRGPQAVALARVRTKLVNNGVLTEVRTGRAVHLVPGRTYPDAERVFWQRALEWAPNVGRVADLLAGRAYHEAEALAKALFAWKFVLRSQVDPPDQSDVTVYASQLGWLTRPGDVLSFERALLALQRSGWIRIRAQT